MSEVNTFSKSFTIFNHIPTALMKKIAMLWTHRLLKPRYMYVERRSFIQTSIYVCGKRLGYSNLDICLWKEGRLFKPQYMSVEGSLWLHAGPRHSQSYGNSLHEFRSGKFFLTIIIKIVWNRFFLAYHSMFYIWKQFARLKRDKHFQPA